MNRRVCTNQSDSLFSALLINKTSEASKNIIGLKVSGNTHRRFRGRIVKIAAFVLMAVDLYPVAKFHGQFVCAYIGLGVINTYHF